ncbi:SHQ1-domain-containing protein, partial [Clavulina sp. PMI_390]
MITPKFSCSQDDTRVTTKCYMPAIRASDVDIHVDGQLVTLHVNPYFLRLTFSHRLVEDDESSAQYDPSTGYLTIVLTKEVPNQHFDDLDLLAKLLAPSTSASSIPAPRPSGDMIEISARHEADIEYSPCGNLIYILILRSSLTALAAKNDWRLPQSVAEEETPLVSIGTRVGYGFLDAYSGYFKYTGQTPNEVNELGELAETAVLPVRTEMRTAHEDQKWDGEYYMADFMNDDEIQELISWESPFPSTSATAAFEFTQEEQDVMLKLPRKEYLPTPAQNHQLHMALLCILFGFAYDCRTTQHDPTSESAWTIAVLTPCFSALDVSFTSPESAFRASYRRALTFPLYRNWELCERVRQDVGQILAGGKREVCRRLLEVRAILEKHEVYYIYNKIWVDDYCVWIQSQASDGSIRSLGDSVQSLKMRKALIGWGLAELEEAA